MKSKRQILKELERELIKDSQRWDKEVWLDLIYSDPPDSIKKLLGEADRFDRKFSDEVNSFFITTVNSINLQRKES